jgi:putative spermidine/putrescine transport system ATP-binding protein
MNRLEATVLDGGSGAVAYGGVTLTVEAARGRAKGDRVLVLVRPETVDVAPANGDGGADTLSGDVITQTFLGPVTRLKIVGPDTDLIADVSTVKAASLPVGMRVTASLPAGDARVLELSDEPLPEIAEEPAPAGR